MSLFKKEDAIYWVVLVGILSILYFVFSDGQFSVIFTLSGTVQTFGFVLIAIKIRKSRSVTGLSRQTFICYTVIFSVRSILFVFYKGYLPYDSTGNSVFKIQEIIATLISAYILYCTIIPFKSSYNKDLDTIKSYYLIAFAAVMGLIFHSNLNRSAVADWAWAFSQYLQTIAILSQFYLFYKKGGDIETYTSNFIAAQAISRVLSIFFWVFTYSELNDDTHHKSSSLLPQYAGEWFMVSQLIHLFILADFMYYWVKSVLRGEGLQLPSRNT